MPFSCSHERRASTGTMRRTRRAAARGGGCGSARAGAGGGGGGGVYELYSKSRSPTDPLRLLPLRGTHHRTDVARGDDDHEL